MDNTVLELRAIKKYYADAKGELKVLENISLKVGAGEFVVLLGHSGCGKSTLLNVAGLLDRPTSGQVFVRGAEASAMPESGQASFRMRKIGFVFQFDSMLSEFSLAENVDMPALISGAPDLEFSKTLLARFGLLELAHKLPATLSGGEKQRGALARAMRNRPDMLLADEPTGNLDDANAALVFGDLKRLSREGTAVLMVTHNTEAAAYADRVLRLAHGVLSDATSEFH